MGVVKQDIKEGHDITVHRLRRLKGRCSSGSGIHLVHRQTQTLLEYRLVLAQCLPGFPVPGFANLALEPVTPSLEGIGRDGNSAPILTRKQFLEGDVHSGLVKAGYGPQEAFIGIAGFAVS